MPGGKFEIALKRLDEESARPWGIDDVEFLISANPGQKPQPLVELHDRFSDRIVHDAFAETSQEYWSWLSKKSLRFTNGVTLSTCRDDTRSGYDTGHKSIEIVNKP